MILYLSNLHNIINFLTKSLTVFTDFGGLKGSECSIFYALTSGRGIAKKMVLVLFILVKLCYGKDENTNRGYYIA